MSQGRRDPEPKEPGPARALSGAGPSATCLVPRVAWGPCLSSRGQETLTSSASGRGLGYATVTQAWTGRGGRCPCGARSRVGPSRATGHLSSGVGGKAREPVAGPWRPRPPWRADRRWGKRTPGWRDILPVTAVRADAAGPPHLPRRPRHATGPSDGFFCGRMSERRWLPFLPRRHRTAQPGEVSAPRSETDVREAPSEEDARETHVPTRSGSQRDGPGAAWGRGRGRASSVFGRPVSPGDLAQSQRWWGLCWTLGWTLARLPRPSRNPCSCVRSFVHSFIHSTGTYWSLILYKW